MDATGELRSRMLRVQKIAYHELRLSEHAVFDRLVYKNRSQHRRAPYFRRLEHVRRKLRAITKQAAWKTILHQPKREVMAFSSLTLSDFEALENSFRDLIQHVVPIASRSIVTELICRGYFIPFSVAVMSSLSRILVVESTLAQQLTTVISEMRALLAIDQAATDSAPQEDIGEPLQLPSAEANNSTEIQERLVSPRRHITSEDERLRRGATLEAVPPKQAMYSDCLNAPASSPTMDTLFPPNQTSASLYDLLSVDRDPRDSEEAILIVGGNSGTNVVRTPPFPPFGSLAGSEKGVPDPGHASMGQSEGTENRIRESGNGLIHPATSKSEKFAEVSGTFDGSSIRGTCTESDNLKRDDRFTSNFTSENGGDEDIDDIFAALE